MPIIDITVAALQSPTRLHLHHLGAVMCWPGGGERFKAVLAEGRKAFRREIMLQGAELIEAGAIPVPSLSPQEFADLLRTVSDQPAIDMQEGLDRVYFEGALCGLIVHVAIDRADRAGASLTLESCKRDAQTAFGKVPNGYPFDLKTLNNTVWNKYRPVAHLWAARLAMPRADNKRGFPCRGSELPLFLARAEEYLERGASLRLKQSPVTLLDKVKAWRAPPDLPLPASDEVPIIQLK